MAPTRSASAVAAAAVQASSLKRAKREKTQDATDLPVVEPTNDYGRVYLAYHSSTRGQGQAPPAVVAHVAPAAAVAPAAPVAVVVPAPVVQAAPAAPVWRVWPGLEQFQLHPPTVHYPSCLTVETVAASCHGDSPGILGKRTWSCVTRADVEGSCHFGLECL